MAKGKTLPSRNALLLNGAALLIGLVSVSVAVRSTLFKDDVARCTERYVNATRLSLDQNGSPLSGAELQARAAGSDWGLIERASTVKLKSGPEGFALQFDLAPAAATGDDNRSGAGFNWAPRSVAGLRAACLSYSMFLPESMEYAGGGRLPGLTGLVTEPGKASDDDAPQLTTRIGWHADGRGSALVRAPGATSARPLHTPRPQYLMPRGRWVQVEQEVVLNAPEGGDGQFRIWHDGTLVHESADVAYYRAGAATLTGAVIEAAVVPARTQQPKSADAGHKLWLTAIELRWN